MSVQALIDGWSARDGTRIADAFTPDGVRVEYARPARGSKGATRSPPMCRTT
jgi:hypothetical protein